ncbi:RNA 2',3'-cyclic phosphodiesterase [Bdellovibrio sp. HCB337]|uniref:RNA 2',3'-cyclic phosphodiesterase n=1 Tax=Bdellovibrio sp. HCB337 TaxID=3394358 RepID=UPI0039A5110E
MKRLFLAIATRDGLEESATQIVKKLRINADQKQLDIRWTPFENYHVTLVYLGSTNETKIPEIEILMQEAAEITAPFHLKISDVGAYPDEFTSRVLWFGVQNSRALRGLQSLLVEKLKDKNYQLENREYSPHLTIGRLRNPHKTKDLMSPFTRKKIAKILVGEIVLFESVGSYPFPVYKALKTFTLTGKPSEYEDLTDVTSSEAE